MLPAAVLDAATKHYRDLQAEATGTVFELPAADAVPALCSKIESGHRYDVILSYMRTPAVDDLAALTSALSGALNIGGWVGMVEPRESGARRVQWLRRPLPGGRQRHYRFRPTMAESGDGHDLVAQLWAGGFTVTEIHRLEVPSAPRRSRNYLWLRARHQL